jgi:hypothetical protein
VALATQKEPPFLPCIDWVRERFTPCPANDRVGEARLEGHPAEGRPGPYASEHTCKVVGLFLASRATFQPG